MQDTKRITELQKAVINGHKAEEMLDFAKKFLELEQRLALNDLVGSAKNPQIIQQDLKAAVRFVRFIESTIGNGILSKERIERITNG